MSEEGRMPGAEEDSEGGGGLSEEVLRIAREELGENPATREDDVEAVRAWLIVQPHLNARTGEVRSGGQVREQIG